MITSEFFAHKEYKDYSLYKALKENEPNPRFKQILQLFTDQKHEDFQFWNNFIKNTEKVENVYDNFACKKYKAGYLKIMFYKAMRRGFGLFFTIKLVQKKEKELLEIYQEYFTFLQDEFLRSGMKRIIEQKIQNEKALLSQTKNTNMHFISSIVLGVNDGLIELTSALVGFSFAMKDIKLVSLAGIIVGLSAALSMAASAFMQARSEKDKDPIRAALFTGLSYLSVVVALVTPFYIFSSMFLALGVMLAISILIVTILTFYISIIFERNFGREFRIMLFFSLGVSIIAFLLGSVLRSLSGLTL